MVDALAFLPPDDVPAGVYTVDHGCNNVFYAFCSCKRTHFLAAVMIMILAFGFYPPLSHQHLVKEMYEEDSITHFSCMYV